MDYENRKKGHGTMALIMGILAIVVAVFVGVTFGMFGIIPALLLAAGAIIFGIMTIRVSHGQSGKGGVIIGIIALLITGAISGMIMTLGSFLKSEEIQKNVPTLAAYADDSWRGIAGILVEMSKDGVDLDKMSKEMEAFSASGTGAASGDGAQAQTQAVTE